MMGLVVFAMVMGVILGIMKDAGKPVLHFFRSLGNATMMITSKVVRYGFNSCSLNSTIIQER